MLNFSAHISWRSSNNNYHYLMEVTAAPRSLSGQKSLQCNAKNFNAGWENSLFVVRFIILITYLSLFQRDITKKLGSPKQPSNPFLEMVKFLLERIAPVHIDTESIRYCVFPSLSVCAGIYEGLSHNPISQNLEI